MGTDVKWWELNTDISPNVSLPLGHDGVLAFHPHQGIGNKKPLRCAGGIHGPNSILALFKNPRQMMTLKLKDCLMNLFVSDAYR